jgi:glycosyltransferase involved in cell wall biosynthesis
MAALIQRFLQAQPFDLIIASEIGPGTGTSFYITGTEGIPCVLEDMELSMIRSKIQAQHSRVGRWRYQLTWWKLQSYISRLLQRMAACTVASADERKLVRQLAPDGLPLAVIPNGLDLKSYAGDFGAPEPDSLIFSGALTYGPNWEAMQFFLTKIFPLVKVQRPGVTLRVTGRTDRVSQERLPQRSGVIFTGYLDDIRPSIAQSWVSIVPLLQGGGSRIKILEAMALGTPVVSTSQGAEGLEVTHNEDIFIADEPIEFANGVLRLLGDPALRARLASNGRRLVRERYDWEQIGKTLDQFLHRVVRQYKCRDTA